MHAIVFVEKRRIFIFLRYAGSDFIFEGIFSIFCDICLTHDIHSAIYATICPDKTSDGIDIGVSMLFKLEISMKYIL